MSARGSLDLQGESEIPRVLVCDDNQTNLALAKAVLERHGFFVVSCYSGEEALQELRKHSYDLVVLDIEMPEMSGLELTRILRAEQGKHVFLPIILLTARTDNASRVEGLEAGATDFLTKPFDPSELVARIRNFVASKRVHDRLVMTNNALQAERNKVHKVQMGLLPSAMPAAPGLEFGATYRPCAHAGGDFYDAFARPNGNLILAMGDVSGHGIPAAMYMAIVRAQLHAGAAAGLAVHEILNQMNNVLKHGLDEYSFVTMYLAEYNPSTGELVQASAAHPAPLLQDLQTGLIAPCDLSPTFPLGLEVDFAAVPTAINLRQGHRLVLFTDGILEQTNRQREPFDELSLIGALYEAATLRAAEVPPLLVSRLLDFAEAPSFTDDVTLLVMDVITPPGG